MCVQLRLTRHLKRRRQSAMGREAGPTPSRAAARRAAVLPACGRGLRAAALQGHRETRRDSAAWLPETWVTHCHRHVAEERSSHRAVLGAPPGHRLAGLSRSEEIVTSSGFKNRRIGPPLKSTPAERRFADRTESCAGPERVDGEIAGERGGGTDSSSTGLPVSVCTAASPDVSGGPVRRKPPICMSVTASLLTRLYACCTLGLPALLVAEVPAGCSGSRTHAPPSGADRANDVADLAIDAVGPPPAHGPAGDVRLDGLRVTRTASSSAKRNGEMLAIPSARAD